MKKIILLILFSVFLYPSVSSATVTYTRTPSDFYAGHGVTITVESDDPTTDYGSNCFALALGGAMYDNGGYYSTTIEMVDINQPVYPTSSTMVFDVPDDLQYLSVYGFLVSRSFNPFPILRCGLVDYSAPDFVFEVNQDLDYGYYKYIFTTFPIPPGFVLDDTTKYAFVFGSEFMIFFLTATTIIYLGRKII